MRIGFVSGHGMRLGGVEHYIDRVFEDLHALGHEVALFCEVFRPESRAAIRMPPGAPRFAVDALGAEEALRAFFEWEPEIVYAHGLDDPGLEERIVGRRPTVYFPHTYLDTCISTGKAHHTPVAQPCDRVFGPACLVQYFPRRCGGLNPVTMVRLYQLRARKIPLLGQYDAVITHSEHLRREYIKHGVPPERIRTIPYTSTLPATHDYEAARARARSFRAVVAAREAADAPPAPLRILLASRMEEMKGGGVLLDALPTAARALGLPVHAVLAGDGPDRAAWQKKAEALCAGNPALTIELPGWLSPADVRARMAEAHLLAFPSLWPEPYGLSGLEALGHGLPVVGFAVGGIPEWLHEGENGCLAPGNPPTAGGLASAIVRAARDADKYASMCEGAVRSLEGRVPALHTTELLRLFESLLGRAPQPSAATPGGGGAGRTLAGPRAP